MLLGDSIRAPATLELLDTGETIELAANAAID
jgi:hypothetical protein